MNKINLLIIALAALLSCKTKIDTSKENHSSFDINVELKKNSNDSVTYYRNLQLDTILTTLIKNDSIGTTLGESSENAPYLMTVRTKPGLVEIHEQMDDIAIIRSGHGTLKIGHEVAGNIRTSGEEPWRNWFCDTVKSAADQQLSPGDFVIIPAMTAHQYIPNGGDTLTYWTIKVKRLKKIN
jgi:mannose-6-phosphate isomerase-like protein (cupin superfamily)